MRNRTTLFYHRLTALSSPIPKAHFHRPCSCNANIALLHPTLPDHINSHILMSSTPLPMATRESSLGFFHLLPDSLIIEGILTLLTPKDLCLLSQVSRYLHIFARNDLLWRRLFFAKRGRRSTRLVYRGSWLLTYLFPGPEHDEACSIHPLVTRPTQIQGVSSDYLHQQWLRSSMYFGHFYPPPPMPPTPAIGGNRPVNPTIPVENYQDLDSVTFYRRYAYPNRPVMVQNSGVDLWPAWEQWTLDALAAKHGNTLFRVSNIDSNTVPSFDLCFKDFLHYLRYNRDQDPLYLFDPRFADIVPEMGTAYEVPMYFKVDFFSLLKEDARPPYRWILIGPQRTGAPWHIDPSGTSAWNTLLSGHKRWALYPPHMVPPGHDPTSPKRMSSVEWYLDVYPFLSPEVRPIEIVQHPGQTIYVPSGWWHMVLNLDDTVAVTQNFADETNICQVKRALRMNRNETVQVERWEAIARELPALRPDLALAIQSSPEDQLLAQLKRQTSWLEPSSPDSLPKWQERVRHVLQHHINNADPMEITLIRAGQNLCFLSSAWFVKFFTPFHDGHESFLSEVRSNLILLDTAEARAQHHVLSSPKMLGYGYLLNADQAAPLDWRWPYVVMENELCQESSERTSDSQLVAAKEYMPEDKSGYVDLLLPILRVLQYFHTLDPAFLAERDHGHTPSSGRESVPYVAQSLQSAVAKHYRWRAFPKHLLESLPDYLPKDAKEVFDPARGDPVATIIHGDVNPGNILGRLGPAQTIPGAVSNEKSPPVEPVTSPQIGQQAFQPTSLIDFGDAVFQGDPLIDIVSVFITILNCRQDLGLCSFLLEYWRSLSKINAPLSVGARLARRCMWHVLLWPSEGLSAHLVRCVPEIGEMSTWEQVEEAIFGWWSSL
ncbi:hypothetical protein EDD21DRAFT_381473 [Dissophora ornata]|nr:hypothetical protein EDD21DRAFT_381473 [Dissophora ornata]